jgi:hypothetical protein
MESRIDRSIDRMPYCFAGEYVVHFALQDGKFAPARFDLGGQVGFGFSASTFGCASRQSYVAEWLAAATHS